MRLFVIKEGIMKNHVTRVPYIPQSAVIEEVDRALGSYYEVPFVSIDSEITAKTKLGEYQCLDYSGQDYLLVMPELAGRPECLSCFFVEGTSDLFYQTREYIRFYDDNMALKKLYMIEDIG
jgi:hypothetical protein